MGEKSEISEISTQIRHKGFYTYELLPNAEGSGPGFCGAGELVEMR